MNALSGNSRAMRLALAGLLCAMLVSPALAVIHLTRGADAPAFTLKDLGGVDVSLEKLRGQIVVVVFGEVYHDKTRQACTQLDTVLHDARFEGQQIVPLLLTAGEVKPDELRMNPGERLPATILRDPSRQAFGDYQVAVMPSVVVVDREGHVVHAMAGLTNRFPDLMTDSLLFSLGKLSAERFEDALNPQPTTTASADMRAERITQLGRQLARRGMNDLAGEKFREALGLDPHHGLAHLELGLLLLKQRRLAEAEAEFRAVLAEQPNSMQGALGLAFVQTLRGGAELDQAERTVRDLLAKNPMQPRAHFLMGMISELRGKPEEAAVSFKKSAQLLLERSEEE